jgi:3-dehydroquinate synthase
VKPKIIKMKLGKATYPILVGKDISNNLASYIPKKTSKVIIISDERLTKKRKELLNSLKSLSIPVIEIPVTAGENLKKIKSVYPLFGKILEARADRDSLIIALGGGTVGDVAGFIAATYMRGINWIGVPSTLLAQVDSSVGGKTGINHEAGKNLIGAFHQPILVVCDVSYLKTLGPREKISGLGEVIKYSLTFDKHFFKWLQKNLNLLIKGNPEAMTEAIKKSLEWKCFSVSEDVEDRLGKREILNFGHTLGHALESSTQYGKFQHGEAVIWGMRFALHLSQIRGHLSESKREKMDELLQRLTVPAIPKSIKKEDIFKHMKRDKKSQGNSIRFVLLDDIGHSVSDASVTQKDLDEAFLALTGRKD